MAEIKSITIVTREGANSYLVGETLRNSSGNVCGKIDRIEDESKEFPDHVHVQFNVYSSTGSIVAKVINCGVDVSYF